MTNRAWVAGLVAVLALLGSACQPSIDAASFEEDAQAVVEDLGAHRFGVVASRFTPGMAREFPESAMTSFWLETERVLGAYGGVLAGTESTTSDGVAVIDVPARFGSASMKTRVSFNVAGQIAGLFLLDPTTPLPSNQDVLLGWVLIVSALILALAGWLGWQGQLARNWLVGIRVKSTMRSDAAWEAAHRTAGPWIVVSGGPLLLAGLLTLINGVDDALVLVATGLMLVPLLVGSFLGIREAKLRG